MSERRRRRRRRSYPPGVLHDRIVGLLCLGAAVVTATWGGNGALKEASAQAARAARLAAHADAVAPGVIGADSAPGLAADPSSTTITAPASSTTTAAPAASTTTTVPGEAPAVLVKRALLDRKSVV